MIRAMLSLMVPALMIAAPAAAQDRPPSHCFAVAEGPRLPGGVLRASLKEGVERDHVRIRYLDHSSFAIVTPGGTVAVTDYNGFLGSADLVPDVVTMNNAHRTHWTANPDPRIVHVLQGWDTAGAPTLHHLGLGDILVRNVPTDVRSGWEQGGRRNGNSIFVFEAGGLCIGHLGHLHHIPDEAQFASIGRLDVVMVPVDGGYTMNAADMALVVKRLRSSVVLPMHWFSGASLQIFLTGMAGEFDVVETGLPQIDLSQRDLPGRPTILVLEPEFLN